VQIESAMFQPRKVVLSSNYINETDRYTDVTDQALAYISVNCPELRMLQLCECTEVTDDGLRALANGCSKISEIDLTGTSVSDKGVAYLKSKCPRVMSLRL